MKNILKCAAVGMGLLFATQPFYAFSFGDITGSISSGFNSAVNTVEHGTLSVVNTVEHGTLSVVNTVEHGTLNVVNTVEHGTLNVVNTVEHGTLNVVNTVEHGTLNVVNDIKNGTMTAVNDVKNGTMTAVNDVKFAADKTNDGWSTAMLQTGNFLNNPLPYLSTLIGKTDSDIITADWNNMVKFDTQAGNYFIDYGNAFVKGGTDFGDMFKDGLTGNFSAASNDANNFSGDMKRQGSDLEYGFSNEGQLFAATGSAFGDTVHAAFGVIADHNAIATYALADVYDVVSGTVSCLGSVGIMCAGYVYGVVSNTEGLINALNASNPSIASNPPPVPRASPASEHAVYAQQTAAVPQNPYAAAPVAISRQQYVAPVNQQSLVAAPVSVALNVKTASTASLAGLPEADASDLKSLE